VATVRRVEEVFQNTCIQLWFFEYDEPMRDEDLNRYHLVVGGMGIGTPLKRRNGFSDFL